MGQGSRDGDVTIWRAKDARIAVREIDYMPGHVYQPHPERVLVAAMGEKGGRAGQGATGGSGWHAALGDRCFVSWMRADSYCTLPHLVLGAVDARC